MRREDRAITLDDSKNILLKGEYGILSTVNENNIPYGVPLSYAYDLATNRIEFHSAIEGHKISNFITNPNVSFCVVGKTKVLESKFSTEYESVIASGEIEELFDDKKKKSLMLLVEKYSPKFIKEGEKYIDRATHKTRVFSILVKNITGKGRR